MEADTHPEAPEVDQERPMFEYFTGQMPTVPLSARYKLGLFAVAVAMVLLPLIYLGFIASIAGAMWWWATHALNWFFPVINGTRRVFWVLGFLYIIPLIVGLMLILFMLTSFFSRWRIIQFAVPISHEDHPEIFRFLGQLCQQMEAPIPSRVDVTLDINASAGFRAGFGSLFGNDIMLTLGLPLVASMNCREFAAVVAHELGHFRQRSAMRCDYVIRQVHGWLLRTVYERDDLDDLVDEATDASAFSLVIYIFTRIAITFTRVLMWLLLVLGHALTSFLSRQMEFHADACATAVAGSDGFVAMLHRLRILGVAFQQAATVLKNRVAAKYPDDLATYVASLAGQCSGQLKGKVIQAAEKEKTRWFESHPAHHERIQRAMQADQPGIIHDLRPATVLFDNFPELSRTLTLASYQLPGRRKPVLEEQVFHVEAQSSQETAPDTSAEEAAIKNYFRGLGLFLKPLLFGAEARMGATLASARLDQWKAARATLEQKDLFSYRESLKQLDASILQAMQANALMDAGMALNPESFPSLPVGNSDFASQISSFQAERQRLDDEMMPFEQAARTRLLAALNMLSTPLVAGRITNTQALQEEVRDLLHVFGKLSAAFPALLELRKHFAILQTLLGVREQSGSNFVETALSDSVQPCDQLLTQIQESIGSVSYPFDTGPDHMSVAKYARAKSYDADPARMTQLEAQSHLQMLFALYHRLLGRLVAVAVQVEAEIERSPIPA